MLENKGGLTALGSETASAGKEAEVASEGLTSRWLGSRFQIVDMPWDTGWLRTVN